MWGRRTTKHKSIPRKRLRGDKKPWYQSHCNKWNQISGDPKQYCTQAAGLYWFSLPSIKNKTHLFFFFFKFKKSTHGLLQQDTTGCEDRQHSWQFVIVVHLPCRNLKATNSLSRNIWKSQSKNTFSSLCSFQQKDTCYWDLVTIIEGMGRKETMRWLRKRVWNISSLDTTI